MNRLVEQNQPWKDHNLLQICVSRSLWQLVMVGCAPEAISDTLHLAAFHSVVFPKIINHCSTFHKQQLINSIFAIFDSLPSG